jgi:hypothetical protein
MTGMHNVANMRRKELLHKLILPEAVDASLQMRPRHASDSTTAIARKPCRDLHLNRRSGLSPVPEYDGDLPIHFLVVAQRRSMDLEQAITQQNGESVVHLDGDTGAALLDR